MIIEILDRPEATHTHNLTSNEYRIVQAYTKMITRRMMILRVNVIIYEAGTNIIFFPVLGVVT